jgi:hypothetical protein
MPLTVSEALLLIASLALAPVSMVSPTLGAAAAVVSRVKA